MIGSLIGAGLGLASSVYGGIKSAQAARKQQRLLNQAKGENQAWYEKNYYQDYMDRSDAQAAMGRVRDYMKRRNQEIDKTAAVTGATPEAVAAQQANASRVIGETASNIQANADARKDQVDQTYMNQKNNLLNAEIGQQQANEAGGAQLAGLGLQGTANAIASSALTSQEIKPGVVSPELKADYGLMSAEESLKKMQGLTGYKGV